jgi:hypothetical protein
MHRTMSAVDKTRRECEVLIAAGKTFVDVDFIICANSLDDGWRQASMWLFDYVYHGRSWQLELYDC